MEQHEREWKATWEDDAWDRAREFELYDPAYPVEALEVQEKTDASQCLPSPVQTNTTPSAALVKTSGSPAQVIQPVRGTVLPRSVQNAVRGRVGYGNNITPYEAAQGLMKTIPMFCIGKSWLVYQQGYYTLKSSEDVKRVIMEVCRPAVEQCGSANFVDQIFKILKTEPKLFIHPTLIATASLLMTASLTSTVGKGLCRRQQFWSRHISGRRSAAANGRIVPTSSTF